MFKIARNVDLHKYRSPQVYLKQLQNGGRSNRQNPFGVSQHSENVRDSVATKLDSVFEAANDSLKELSIGKCPI